MLDGEVVTLAFCWRVERRDGVAIGLTGHDRDLPIDGLVYRASPGMVPAAVRRESGLAAAGIEVAGALSSAAIGEADLIAGRWDGAAVTLFAVDWTDPARRVALGDGRIGAVSVSAGRFSAALEGPGAALDRPVAEACSPECRARLGDQRCRVSMATRRRWARVLAVDDDTVTVDAVEPVAGAYAQGRLRWFDGGNGGLESAIASSDGATLELRTAPAFPVAAGALVELIEGCDGSLATCAGRFGNAANFRGEPYLPGVDLLTRAGLA